MVGPSTLLKPRYGKFNIYDEERFLDQLFRPVPTFGDSKEQLDAEFSGRIFVVKHGAWHFSAETTNLQYITVSEIVYHWPFAFQPSREELQLDHLPQDEVEKMTFLERSMEQWVEVRGEAAWFMIDQG